MTVQELSEADIARIWACEALPGTPLTLVSGVRLQVLFGGRLNRGFGPDFQDAVLLDEAGRRLHGDIEIHLRTSDWRRHGHHEDPRYNRVLLHVVHISDDGPYTPLASGAQVPVLALDDHLPAPNIAPAAFRWPCQDTTTRPSPPDLDALLVAAGMARFAERVARFTADLRAAAEKPLLLCNISADDENKGVIIDDRQLSVPWPFRARSADGWTPTDLVLIPAVAEGLGYGRDRAIFHQAALALLARPDPLIRSCDWAVKYPIASAGIPTALASLDAQRQAGLVILMRAWWRDGLWPHCRAALRSAARKHSNRQTLASPPCPSGSSVVQPTSTKKPAMAARVALEGLLQPHLPSTRTALISRARAAIIICNVVLPFAAAVGALTGERSLIDVAHTLYRAYPSLESNRITRAMAAQLRLVTPPRGALRQQGLHHLYQRFCVAKLCGECPCGRQQNE